jgi:UPF0716 family protein affecting phage T7 exclusion
MRLTDLVQVIVATHHAYITGVSGAEAAFLFRQNGPPNPIYRRNAYLVASTVLLWPGVVASFARFVLIASLGVLTSLQYTSSTYIMWKSHQHDDQFGPRSSKWKGTKGEEGSIDMANTQPFPAAATVAPTAPTQSRTTPYPGT